MENKDLGLNGLLSSIREKKKISLSRSSASEEEKKKVEKIFDKMISVLEKAKSSKS